MTKPPLTDCTAFERDLLYAVRALEQDTPPNGLTIKQHLEAEYDEVNHSRLYQNLDGLADKGLLTKGQKDERTNEYATTDLARSMLDARIRQRAHALGLSIEGGETA